MNRARDQIYLPGAIFDCPHMKIGINYGAGHVLRVKEGKEIFILQL